MIVYSKWSTLSAGEAIKVLQSSAIKGLDAATVSKNGKLYGNNFTSGGERTHILNEIWKHVKSPLLLLFIITTIISYSLGEPLNASIILFIIKVLGVNEAQLRTGWVWNH